jgi:cytochrome c-type biogenesis protein
MFEDLFNYLTLAMSERLGIALAASFGWGIVSVILSPCHLASIPLVVGYLSAQGKSGLKHPLLLSFAFAVGILASIAVIGIVTAALGRMLGDVGIWGSIIVAGVFFLVGLYLMELIHIPWGGFATGTPAARGWTGALLLGFLFGIGLGPCTFAFLAPVLGLVFTLASANLLQAVALLGAFSLGHCSVIVLAGGAAAMVQRYLKWTEGSPGARIVKKSAGALVFLAGVYFLITM